MKNWLASRKRAVPGRDLKPGEVRHITEMARRIAAPVSLRAALDESYEYVMADISAPPRATSIT